MTRKRFLNDAELAAAKFNLAQAKASLACEGMYLTPEQDALFREFEEQRLPHEERRRRIIERYKGRGVSDAAE